MKMKTVGIMPTVFSFSLKKHKIPIAKQKKNCYNHKT